MQLLKKIFSIIIPFRKNKSEFKYITQEIKKYSLSSILDSSISLLIDAENSNKKNFPFWNVLLIVKWAYLNTNDRKRLKSASKTTILEIIHQIEKFDYERKTIDFKKDIKRSFRIVAYQQYWYQDHIDNSVFARQIILYTQLKSSLDIDKNFKNETGITTQQFLKLSYVTYLYLHQGKLLDQKLKYDGIIHSDCEELLFQVEETEVVKIFLNFLTLKAIEQLNDTHKMSDAAFQLYETNFWCQIPFFYHDNQRRIFHSAIFGQTCKYFIYNYMKKNSHGFPEEFGKRLEKYLELGLKEIRVNYRNENELKKQVSLTKVCDLFVEENILIECKAIEIHPRTAILRNSSILQTDFKHSIVKAYIQLLKTANSIDNSKTFFGFIVTYKNIFVGFGEDAWSDFLDQPINEFLSKEKDISLSVLPPANLFFIDIEDWDKIIQIIKDYKINFNEIIEKVITERKNVPSIGEYLFMEQILTEYYPIKKINLDYLNKAQKAIEL